MDSSVECVSEFEVQEFNTKYFDATLKWPLKEIPSDASDDYKFLWICNLHSVDNRTYCLLLTANETSLYYSLCLILTSTNNDKIESSVTFANVDNNGSEINVQTYDGPTTSEPLCISNFYYKEIDIEPFQFICRIKFNVKKIFWIATDLKELDQISEDFGQLLENKNLSDVILKTSSAELSAHRVILSARSPVFAAMFSNETKERKEGVVQIDDIEPDILQAMLSFIYTGRVEDVDSKAADLYKVADKYAIEGLKLMCADVLCKIMNIKNVIGILLLADLYSTENLKQKALNFIKEHLKDIVGSTEFKNLKALNPQLLEDIVLLFIA